MKMNVLLLKNKHKEGEFIHIGEVDDKGLINFDVDYLNYKSNLSSYTVSLEVDVLGVYVVMLDIYVKTHYSSISVYTPLSLMCRTTVIKKDKENTRVTFHENYTIEDNYDETISKYNLNYSSELYKKMFNRLTVENFK